MEQIEKKLLIFYDYLLSKSKEPIVYHNNHTYRHSHVQRSTCNKILKSFEFYFKDELASFINQNNKNKED